MFVQQNCQKTVSVYLLDCWDQVGRRCDSEATSPSHLLIRKWGIIFNMNHRTHLQSCTTLCLFSLLWWLSPWPSHQLHWQLWRISFQPLQLLKDKSFQSWEIKFCLQLRKINHFLIARVIASSWKFGIGIWWNFYWSGEHSNY